ILILAGAFIYNNEIVNAQNLAVNQTCSSEYFTHSGALYKPLPVTVNLFDTVNMKKKMPMNTFWKGAGVGFAIGGSIGIGFGLLGKDWVLDDGTIVPRWQHALVDMFIFAAP